MWYGFLTCRYGYLYLTFLLLLNGGSWGFHVRLQRWGAGVKSSKSSPSPFLTRTATSLLPATKIDEQHMEKAAATTTSTTMTVSQTMDEPSQKQEKTKKKNGKKEEANEIRDWLQQRLDLSDAEIEVLYVNGAQVFRPRGQRRSMVTTGRYDVTTIPTTTTDPNTNTYTTPSSAQPRIKMLDDRINWFQTRLNLTNKEVSKTFLRNRDLLGRTSTSLDKKLVWIQSRLELDNKQLRLIVVRYPQILSNSIEDSTGPKIDWLQKTLGLTSKKDLRTVVVRSPSFLALSSDTLDNRIKWYEERLAKYDGTYHDDVKRKVKMMIKRSPSLLYLDPNFVDEKLTWLQSRLELTDLQVCKIFQSFPNVVVSSNIEDRLERQIEYLSTLFCADPTSTSDDGPNIDTVREMICKYPQLLSSLSIENISSTMEFYESIVGKSTTQRYVIGSPSLLGYSLENRLIPRLADTEQVGLVIGKDLSLHDFVRYTNDDWEDYIKQYR